MGFKYIYIYKYEIKLKEKDGTIRGIGQVIGGDVLSRLKGLNKN